MGRFAVEGNKRGQAGRGVGTLGSPGFPWVPWSPAGLAQAGGAACPVLVWLLCERMTASGPLSPSMGSHGAKVHGVDAENPISVLLSPVPGPLTNVVHV